MRIAFATCRTMPDGHPDDHAALAALGATYAVWDDPSVNWHRYDRVVVRSVWDYTTKRAEFVAWAGSVGPERLRNTPALIAFNSDKTYLGDLAAATVPTTFVRPGDASPALDGEVVVKPNISAGARDTGRFGPATHDLAAQLITRITASGRTALVQPYLPDVDANGEIGLVHFNGALSHVLRKRAVLRPDEVAPVAADDGVAPAAVMLEDDLVVLGEADAEQLAFAAEVIAELTARFGTLPLYARVDVARDGDGRPVLMEVEAIEPMLYLRISPGAAARFTAAVLAS